MDKTFHVRYNLDKVDYQTLQFPILKFLRTSDRVVYRKVISNSGAIHLAGSFPVDSVGSSLYNYWLGESSQNLKIFKHNSFVTKTFCTAKSLYNCLFRDAGAIVAKTRQNILSYIWNRDESNALGRKYFLGSTIFYCSPDSLCWQPLQ